MFQTSSSSESRAAEQHARDVELLQKQLAGLGRATLAHRSGQPVSHMTSTLKSSSVAPRRALNRVLNVDPQAQTAWVEPGVTMEALCRATLSIGLLPPVVPEFRAITVAGAIMGGALESSSFRHGQFNDACIAYELLLGDGTRIEASPTQHADLFYGVSGSYGSLATLASIKLRLVPAKPWVRINYTVVENPAEALEAAALQSPAPDFLDAVVFGPKHALLMTGYQVDALPKEAKPINLSAPWAQWFCQRLVARAAAPTKPDYLSITDYLFRYDRGAFWMGQFLTCLRALGKVLLGIGINHPDAPEQLHAIFREDSPTLSPSLFFRLGLGWKFSSRSLYGVLHALPRGLFGKTFHVQDFFIPVDRLDQFLAHLDSEVHIYPLWLCPVRGTNTPQFLSPQYLADRPARLPFDFINVGIYGVPGGNRPVPKVTRELEVLAYSLGGRKALYAISYFDRDEFWRHYDRELYTKLRTQHAAVDRFLDLYDRTHRGGK